MDNIIKTSRQKKDQDDMGVLYLQQNSIGIIKKAVILKLLKKLFGVRPAYSTRPFNLHLKQFY